MNRTKLGESPEKVGDRFSNLVKPQAEMIFKIILKIIYERF